MPAFGARPVEQFGVVLLDTKHRVLRTTVLTVGTLNSTDVEAARRLSRGGARRRRSDRRVPQSSLRRSQPEPRRCGADAAAGGGGVADGDRRRRSHHPGRRAVLQLQGNGTAVSRVLYFDCFSGISGDMVLGALLDAGLPLDELKGALGSLASRAIAHVGAERVLRAGVSARSSRCASTNHATSALRASTRTTSPRSRRTVTRAGIASSPSASQSAGDLRADRRVGAVGGGPRSREGAVPAAGGSRSGDSPDAGREGAPARSRRARFDHRHRRRRVRAGVVRRGPRSSARR